MGNLNSGRREQPFLEALRMELGGTRDLKRLRTIAKRLIAKAEDGEPWAVLELANRLDGKPRQVVDVDAEIAASLTVQIIKLADVKPE